MPDKTLKTATAQVLDSCGYDQLAKDCLMGKCTPQGAVHTALRTFPNAKQKECLLKTQKLIGLPKWDLRYYIETGKKRIKQ